MVMKGAETSVEAEALLFVVLGSASEAEMVTVDDTVAALVTATTLFRLTLPPTARFVTLHVSVLPERENEPAELLLETSSEPGGNICVIRTPLAELGPRLVAVIE